MAYPNPNSALHVYARSLFLSIHPPCIPTLFIFVFGPLRPLSPPKKKRETLSQPEPHLLNPIPWPPPLPLRRIRTLLARPNIRLDRPDKARPLPDLPPQVEGEVDGDASVGGDEVVDVEGFVGGRGREDVEAVEEGDKGEVDEGEVGQVGLPGGAEGHVVVWSRGGGEGRVERGVGVAGGTVGGGEGG